MKEIKEDKGRVRPVVEGDFQCDENGNSTRFYEILSLVGYVKDDGTKIGYISKTNVPIGTPITNTDYWYPFQIIAVPKGDKGDKGDDGKSAYELYIEHGGTIAPVEAWLTSLHGKDGKDGQPLMLRVTPDGQSLEISDDGGHTWYIFEKNFSKLRVLGYLNSVSELPRNADIGDIYGVKLPNEEVEPGHSAYELWINTVKGWNEDYIITKIYDYDTELPSYAAEGSTVVVPVKYLTLDKQKIDGYKVYRFDQVKNGWTMILNTAEIFASKEDIVNHGDNVYALVQGDSKKTYHDITNWINGSIDGNNKYQEDLTSIIGTCPIDGSVRELSYNIANGYKADIRILTNEQLNPADIDNPTIVYDTEVVEGTGSITVPSNAKSIIVTIKSVNEEEEIPTSTGTMVSIYSVKEEKIILYKRNTGWVYFGTNASITYILVQDVEEGTSTNILSGEAVKLKFAEFAAALDAFKQEVKDTYGDYEENSEFVRVTLDHDNKVLYGVQADGNFYFGAGCPPQVKDYIDEKIRALSLDEYEAIVYFLNDLEFADKTLQDLLNEKVDKEEGKSLINKEFANGVDYIENPEFNEIKLDGDNKIIEATKKDGTKLLPAGYNLDGVVVKTINNPEFLAAWVVGDRLILAFDKTGNPYFGYGVPKQIELYINNKTNWLEECLNGFEGTNIKEYLDLTFGYYTDIPDYIKVYLDNNNKVIKGIKPNGVEYFAVGHETDASETTVIDNLEFSELYLTNDNRIIKGVKRNGIILFGLGYEVGKAAVTTVIDNPELAKVYLTSDNRIVLALKKDGDVIFGCGVPTQIKDYITSFIDKDAIPSYEDIPGYIELKLDKFYKILAGRTPDGIWFENVGISVGGNVIKTIEDFEERTEIVTDVENKIISYRDKKGVKHENVGLESSIISTNSLKLTDEGISEFEKDLKEHGFSSGQGDWTDATELHIAEPYCAMVNFKGINDIPQAKGVDLQGIMEFWDMQGNYFKKEVIMNAQGNSTLSHPKKNIAIDICNNNGWNDEDTFKFQIGDWVPQDSFHLKGFYNDAFRGVCAVAYKWYEQIVKTRGELYDYVWKRAFINFSAITPTSNGSSTAKDTKAQYNDGAKCFPNGFPCIVYLNGEFYGIYSWQLKKHRDNYHMKKSNAKHIHLDGVISDSTLWDGSIDWTQFEIRNPKSLKTVNGGKYDGDNPTEITGDSSVDATTAEVKQHIEAFSNIKTTVVNAYNTYLASEKTAVDKKTFKQIFEQYFDSINLIDYVIFSDVSNNYDGFCKNWQWFTYDGVKWFCGIYDCDGVFGGYWELNQTIVPPLTDHLIIEHQSVAWIGATWMITPIFTVYEEELNARYKELRDCKIIDTDNIVNLMISWLNRIGNKNTFDKEWTKWSAFIKNDSIHRFYKWVKKSIENIDLVYNYSNI